MERLKRRADFRVAGQATGVTRAQAGVFVLQARARAQAGPARIGFTVSKQVGNAVERNRVRRRLRELVRLAAPAALRAGHDYVVIGRRAALRASFSEMIKELDRALGRVHKASKVDTTTGESGPRLPHRANSNLRKSDRSADQNEH
jgi:ribonuclease P protein component